MMDATRFGFGETGEIEPIAQFDYSALDEAEPVPDETASMTREETEAALKLFRALVQWLWADSPKNRQALLLRAVFASWLFQDEIRCHSLPQIVAGFDHSKPDLALLVADFRRRFPMVAVPHFKP